jgi:acyl carrier protein phosphodiesterase
MDYFLANDTDEFENESSLNQFVVQTHQHLEDHFTLLPANFHPVFSSMKQHHWLYHFRHEAGIEKSFQHLVKRATYLDDATRAFELFKNHQTAMSVLYHQFFPELKKFSLEFIARRN